MISEIKILNHKGATVAKELIGSEIKKLNRKGAMDTKELNGF